ncbi:hypothetical protein BD626DRAFT_492069 [Schizophyllum amplum]|uniref:F-box domain-containing protein n=1 Tax=Schizophyllum amplum TaxID=97359 RepID=A0A550CI80_9AGAR|nr:hypothetical protein BD626DRAFT_492069 [Auriculariopsis ampla]
MEEIGTLIALCGSGLIPSSSDGRPGTSDDDFDPRFSAHAQGLHYLKLVFPSSNQARLLPMVVRHSLVDLHLQSLYSDNVSLDRLFNQIVCCANLQRLIIDLSPGGWISTPAVQVRPQLRRIRVSGFCEAARYLLDMMRAPHLEAVEYKAREYTARGIQSFAAFLSRSNIDQAESMFALCLESSPMLEDLTLTEVRS